MLNEMRSCLCSSGYLPSYGIGSNKELGLNALESLDSKTTCE